MKVPRTASKKESGLDHRHSTSLHLNNMIKTIKIFKDIYLTLGICDMSLISQNSAQATHPAPFQNGLALEQNNFSDRITFRCLVANLNLIPNLSIIPPEVSYDHQKAKKTCKDEKKANHLVFVFVLLNHITWRREVMMKIS